MKFTNISKFIIKFMGGGKINFPFNYLKEVEINGDNDGESGEGAGSSENVIHSLRNLIYDNNGNIIVESFDDFSNKETIEDTYPFTVVKEIGDKSVAELTIISPNQSNEATIIYCTEYDLTKATAYNDWKIGGISFNNFPKNKSITYSNSRNKLQIVGITRDEWISGFNSIDIIDPDHNITFTEIPENERKSFMQWGSDSNQYYFKYSFFEAYCSLNSLDRDTISNKLKDFKQSISSVITTINLPNNSHYYYYLLLFESEGEKIYVPYMEFYEEVG